MAKKTVKKPRVSKSAKKAAKPKKAAVALKGNRTQRLDMRATAEEKSKLKAAAKKAGKSMTEFVANWVASLA